jgi:anti-sigma regulatory factor (Ser/Thr protein kinase)
LTVVFAERIDIGVDLDEMVGMAEWAEGFCEARGLPGKVNFALQLCLEEAVSNIIRHGGLAPDDRVDIALRLEGAQLAVDIIDPGSAFDPLQVAKPAAPQSLEDASIGGQGIELMRRFCQSMSYERLDEKNCLHLIIEIPQSTTAAAD